MFRDSSAFGRALSWKKKNLKKSLINEIELVFKGFHCRINIDRI